MRAARTLFTTATAAILLAACPLAAAAAPATPAFGNFVALGDSYTSGPFIPTQRLDPLGCARSTRNYPALLASRLRVRSYTDMSCGGADTTNMTRPQPVTFGRNPAQFSALRRDTDVVTVGIGGNDYGVFGRLVGTCPALRASDPTGNPCQRSFTVDGVDILKAAITKTQENITTVLKGIHNNAPHATVLAIGYPRIAPASGFCPHILPFANGDYAWLNGIEEALNAAVANAVAADGNSSYVDIFGPSLGHDACAPNGAAWINGQHRSIFAAADYHPLFTGMAGMATAVYRQLTLPAMRPIGR
jgi:lysophospholipase L1-like esterase